MVISQKERLVAYATAFIEKKRIGDFPAYPENRRMNETKWSIEQSRLQFRDSMNLFKAATAIAFGIREVPAVNYLPVIWVIAMKVYVVVTFGFVCLRLAIDIYENLHDHKVSEEKDRKFIIVSIIFAVLSGLSSITYAIWEIIS